MRVLQVIPSVAPTRGGPTHVVLRLARALAARGADVALLAGRADLDPRGEAEARSALGPDVALELVACRGPRRLELAPGLVPALLRRLRWADIAHVHTVFTFPAAVGPPLFRAAGLPYLVRPAGTLDAVCLASRAPREKALALRVYGRANLCGADRVQATSTKELIEIKSLFTEARVALLEVGAGDGEEAPTADAGGPGRRIGYLGRLHPIKRIEALLEAVARLAPTVELALAGAGDPAYAAGLARRAAALGLAGRTRWLGHLAGPAKRAFLAECDLLAFPSAHESFGVAVVEAMAAGRAVVVSPEVALAGEIEAAGAGRVARADPEALAAAIGALLDDGPARARAAGAARALAEARFRWDAVADRTLALYAQILAERRARARG